MARSLIRWALSSGRAGTAFWIGTTTWSRAAKLRRLTFSRAEAAVHACVGVTWRGGCEVDGGPGVGAGSGALLALLAISMATRAAGGCRVSWRGCLHGVGPGVWLRLLV